MNVEQIAERVEAIRQAAGDDEIAHGMEDALYVDLMAAIAAGECDDPKACAALGLTTQGIDFARWCA